MSWGKLQTCIDTWEKGATVTELAPDVRTVNLPSQAHYLYARIGEQWRMAFELGDGNYELVQRGTLTVGKQAAVRIDLSHHVALGNTGVFLERVALVCGDATVGCQSVVTACTVISRGRAVETFRGELQLVDGTVTVTGDRSHSGSMCRGR